MLPHGPETRIISLFMIRFLSDLDVFEWWEMQEVSKLSKQHLMEEALSEQIKERQEMERKLQKLSKTMDHLERAKREEERPLIEEAYRKRLQDDEKFYQEQQEVCNIELVPLNVDDLGGYGCI